MKKIEEEELKRLLELGSVWLKAHAGSLRYGFDGRSDETRIPETLTDLIEKIDKVIGE